MKGRGNPWDRATAQLGLGATIAALAALLSGCTGDPPAPPKSSSSAPSSGSAISPSTPAGDAAAKLAAVVIGAGLNAAAPSTDLGSVTLGPPFQKDPLKVTVTRLEAQAQQTVLQLSVASVNADTRVAPSMFRGFVFNESAVPPAAYLNFLTVIDRTSDVRLFPYQYRWQPNTKPRQACVCMGSTLVQNHPQTWTVILPPLPANTTTADVNLPAGVTDSYLARAPKTAATIKNVHVTHT